MRLCLQPHGIVQTETLVFNEGGEAPALTSTTQVPLVQTESRKVALETEDGAYSVEGEIVSSQTISSKTRTVETVTVSGLLVIFYLYPSSLCLM